MKIVLFYKYKLVNKNGKFVEGVTSNKSDLQIFKSNYTVIYFIRLFKLTKKIPLNEIKYFSQIIQRYLNAGLTISSCLLEMQKYDFKNLKQVIIKINEDIKNGKNFSESISYHKNVFDEVMINIIKTGERIGKLKNSFEEIIEYLDKASLVSKKIKESLRYPMIASAVLIICITFIKNFFIENVIEFMDTLKVEQPFATKFLIKVIFNTKFWALFLVVLAVLKFFTKILVSHKIKIILHKLYFYTPYIGNFIFKKYLFQFNYNIHTLLKNSVNIIEAVEISKKSIKNLYVLEKANSVKIRMLNGESFGSSIENEKIFPPIMSKLIKTSESSSGIVDTLKQLSELYYQEFIDSQDLLIKLIQPIILLTIGSIILLLIFGTIIPLYSSINLIQI